MSESTLPEETAVASEPEVSGLGAKDGKVRTEAINQMHGSPVVDVAKNRREDHARNVVLASRVNPKDDPSVGTMTYGKGVPHARS